jgi:C2H2-type zinc finger protein
MVSDQERKVKVNGGTIIKVKGTPEAGRERPKYYCDSCKTSFSSQLDLEQHKKIDHSKKISSAA